MSDFVLSAAEAIDETETPTPLWRSVMDLVLTAGVYAGLGVVALAAYCITAY